MSYRPGIEFARDLDESDLLRAFRARFHHPMTKDHAPALYLCGNSLGLMPASARDYVEEELRTWEEMGVRGHHDAKRPWLPYHEFVAGSLARLVGAKPIEVVAMNSLTVNLHLMMTSFYRPTPARHRILIEAGAFSSHRYAVASQLRNHGFDPTDALIELAPREGEVNLRTEDILGTISEKGSSIALVLFGGVNFYTGQAFDMARITEEGHRAGCNVAFDLGHAAGNIVLKLHDWNVDWAAWCSYKYLNAGPGAIAGCFVHERFANDSSLPRLAGWWGHEKNSRFSWAHDFQPIPGAEGWQLSNPPILQLAALRASLEIFDEAGMEHLRTKSEMLTGYLEYLLGNQFEILTPRNPVERGAQLSIRVRKEGKRIFDQITKEGVVCDWREPDVIRVAPVPLYNTFEELFRFSEILIRATE